ncbi:hypothetical protein [Tunturiibacter gelidoferens]|uniref:Uncharacterized protein n=1 Tax=Tunturiibacter lichenicola TaxID=2051959 RepID=A0A7Y9NLP6_9BACT|nr:hypothetical protein [Edaphobacter lichenicola]NYF51676.1 hypothetical protein [Edaphobacter lichenicola]
MLADAIRQVFESPITALLICLLLGAVAVSGRFSLKIAQILLVSALFVGLFGIWSHDLTVSLSLLWSVVLLLLLLATGWWLRQPARTLELRVSDIKVISLPKSLGEMLTVQVFFKNLSERTIAMRNIVWAQTRQIPSTLDEEKIIENELWEIVSESLSTRGRDADMPTVNDGESNQVFESSTFGAEELMSFAKGTHAVYFGAIMQDRKRRKNLIEMLFFVGKDGRVHYCSQHNKP